MAWLQVLCVTIAVWNAFVEVTSRSSCPAECHCHRKQQRAVCGNNTIRLTYIPAVPAYVTDFTLIYANIPIVNRTVLQPIANQSLLSLTLNLANITMLSADVFTDFQELHFLDISKNVIDVELLKVAFQSLGSRLRTVILSSMNISYIPRDLFPANTNIKTVHLNNNIIKIFDESLFMTMPSLHTVDVSHNYIEYINFNATSKGKLNVLDLNLAYNSLNSVRSFCWPDGSSRYYKLRNLNLERNGIKSIPSLSKLCFNTVNTLTFNSNPITVLKNNTFNDCLQLQKLQLMNMDSLKTIEELAFNSTSIEILLLAYNPTIHEHMFPGDFPFKWMSRLKLLDFQKTRLKLSLDKLRVMLLQLKSIVYLNLQRTKIYALPPNTLGKLPNLSHLDLQGNYLARWDDRTFSNVTQLVYLSLDGCRISVINETSFPVEMRTTIKSINLGNNQFFCTCDLLWFRTWMDEVIRNGSIKFINYPHSYFCKNHGRIRLDKFKPTYRACKPMNPYIIAAASSAGFVILVIVLSSIVYSYRWDIRYCMYSRRRRQYQKLPGRDVQFKFDAFVSYDSHDIDWMMTEVCYFLETKLGLKLCIHRRDFEGGKMIIDNIMDCMEQSKKIILIVSNNFAKSKWCQYEVQIALDEHLNNEKDVVVIIREMVARRLMFKSLKVLINSTTYIQWEEDTVAKEVFTVSLAGAMGCEHTET